MQNRGVPEADVSAEFERLLAYLKTSRGFDFSGYKRSTLMRRVEKRMQTVGAASYADYHDYLEVRQDEFPHLFNTILINVTSFFRDPESWDYVSKTLIPRLLEAKGESDPIRVWVAGCASGEEAFTIAIALAEALGPVAFRTRVKIYATDLDEEALSCSRIAQYSPRDVEPIGEGMVDKYFERVGDKLVFDRELRRSIIFGHHDLLQDAPISRVDLLLCRNTLMYFNAEAQERILARFHFALNEGGYLFLGRAETLLTHTSLFLPLDMKNRVFTKVARGRIRNRAFMFPTAPDGPRVVIEGDGSLRDAVFENEPIAQIVLDGDGRIFMANARARTMFAMNGREVGKPFQDSEISYRPAELRTGIEQAIGQRRTIHYKDVAWKTPVGDGIFLEVHITPLTGEGIDVIGVVVAFEDVTPFKRLKDELLSFNQELETAYEEVQSTNEELQTTNEELQSTVEELETTNEELQSTNEELETMNEELQSANEELEAINSELRERSNELDRAKSFLESILASLRDGVIVVDGDFHILAWNERSEDLWGLRSDETVGKHLLNLDIGIPVDQLRTPIRACLASVQPQEISLDIINRRGKPMNCRVALTPLQGVMGESRGVIIVTICKPST